MKNKFWKIQASGNDFVVVDRNSFSSEEELSQLIPKICARKTGIGADGFILLEKVSNSELVWDFYNSDASSAEMCGNASRAIAKLFVESWGGDKKAKLRTLGGTTKLEYISETELKVEMPKRDYIGTEDDGFIWNTGVPHFVFEKDFEVEASAKDFAREHRFPKSLDDRGANVSFWFKSGESFKAVSFERGVEDYTLACGTGACACGLDILRSLGKEEGIIQLELPGGLVKIEKTREAVFLIGDAKLVYEGQWG